MQHGSGKLLQNIGADYISRNAVECKQESCAMCQFAKDEGDSLLANLSSLLTRKKTEIETEIDISAMTDAWVTALANLKDIPIGNIAAWSRLQSEDNVISQAIKYKKSGQAPPSSDEKQIYKRNLILCFLL